MKANKDFENSLEYWRDLAKMLQNEIQESYSRGVEDGKLETPVTITLPIPNSEAQRFHFKRKDNSTLVDPYRLYLHHGEEFVVTVEPAAAQMEPLPSEKEAQTAFEEWAYGFGDDTLWVRSARASTWFAAYEWFKAILLPKDKQEKKEWQFGETPPEPIITIKAPAPVKIVKEEK